MNELGLEKSMTNSDQFLELEFRDKETCQTFIYMHPIWSNIIIMIKKSELYKNILLVF